MIKLVVIIAITLLTAGCSLGDLLPFAYAPEEPAQSLVGDPERGAEIFRVGVDDEATPCSTCHRLSSGGFSLSQGPNLTGISERAATRVEGLTAEQYIEDNILNPARYKFFSFRTSMYDEYADHLSAQDVADLVAYLMTL